MEHSLREADMRLAVQEIPR